MFSVFLNATFHIPTVVYNAEKTSFIEKIISKEIKILMLKVTKSIDFTMLVIRVSLSINPQNLLTYTKTKIMKKIKQINGILKRVKIMNFIKSIVLGVAFVENMV